MRRAITVAAGCLLLVAVFVGIMAHNPTAEAESTNRKVRGTYFNQYAETVLLGAQTYFHATVEGITLTASSGMPVTNFSIHNDHSAEVAVRVYAPSSPAGTYVTVEIAAGATWTIHGLAVEGWRLMTDPTGGSVYITGWN